MVEYESFTGFESVENIHFCNFLFNFIINDKINANMPFENLSNASVIPNSIELQGISS